MYLDEKLIDTVLINADNKDKVNLIQQELEDRHNDIIVLSSEEPKYYLEGFISKMNAQVLSQIAKNYLN